MIWSEKGIEKLKLLLVSWEMRLMILRSKYCNNKRGRLKMWRINVGQRQKNINYKLCNGKISLRMRLRQGECWMII